VTGFKHRRAGKRAELIARACLTADDDLQRPQAADFAPPSDRLHPQAAISVVEGKKGNYNDPKEPDSTL
jgi:hypothetical protein